MSRYLCSSCPVIMMCDGFKCLPINYGATYVVFLPSVYCLLIPLLSRFEVETEASCNGPNHNKNVSLALLQLVFRIVESIFWQICRFSSVFFSKLEIITYSLGFGMELLLPPYSGYFLPLLPLSTSHCHIIGNIN